jgi:hypothetical protein
MSHLPLGRLCALQRCGRGRLEHWGRRYLFLGVVLPNGPLPQRQMDWHRAHQEHPCLLEHLVGVPVWQYSRPRTHRRASYGRSRFCSRECAWNLCTCHRDFPSWMKGLADILTDV